MSDRRRRVPCLDIDSGWIPILFGLINQTDRNPMSESDFGSIGGVVWETQAIRFHGLVINRQVLILKFGPESDFKIST